MKKEAENLPHEEDELMYFNNTFVYESPMQENLLSKCRQAIESLHEEIDEERIM
jgi:hypothetical protein